MRKTYQEVLIETISNLSSFAFEVSESFYKDAQY